MILTDKDLIQFARLGLHHGLIPLENIQRWTDELILTRSEPEQWIFDLAMADWNTAFTILNGHDQNPPSQTAFDLFSALAFSCWKKGQITTDRLVRIGWNLHSEMQASNPEAQFTWGLWIDLLYESYTESWSEYYLNDKRLGEEITDLMLPYVEFQQYLPTWSTSVADNSSPRKDMI